MPSPWLYFPSWKTKPLSSFFIISAEYHTIQNRFQFLFTLFYFCYFGFFYSSQNFGSEGSQILINPPVFQPNESHFMKRQNQNVPRSNWYLLLVFFKNGKFKNWGVISLRSQFLIFPCKSWIYAFLLNSIWREVMIDSLVQPYLTHFSQGTFLTNILTYKLFLYFFETDNSEENSELPVLNLFLSQQQFVEHLKLMEKREVKWWKHWICVCI